MKKLIRFILAVFFTPIAISWIFLDWIYGGDSVKQWRKYITLNK